MESHWGILSKFFKGDTMAATWGMPVGGGQRGMKESDITAVSGRETMD